MKRIRVAEKPDGFINVPVTKTTRDGLHELKVLLDVHSQGDVIAKLVALGLAVHKTLS